MSVKEAVNIPEWKVALVRKYFQQVEKKNTTASKSVGSASDADIEEEFENIFSQSFIENYNADDAFSVESQDNDQDVLKTPRSLKELASKASVMNMSNDSGYEGVDSGLKKRKNLEVAFTEEEGHASPLLKQEMRTEKYRAEKEEEEGEENNFISSILEILKMYVVVASLLYMVYMSETAVGGDLGGKKAAIKFYYDRQQL